MLQCTILVASQHPFVYTMPRYKSLGSVMARTSSTKTSRSTPKIAARRAKALDSGRELTKSTSKVKAVADGKPAASKLADAKIIHTETASTRRDTVNDQIRRQTEQFMNAAKDARIPEQFQAMAEEGVNKSREAFDKISSAAKDQAKVAEDMMLATQAGARAISSKIVDNTVSNTTAVFDAAQAIARAKSLPEATRLQAEFMQKQFALAGAQVQELFELSTRVAKQSFDSASTVAAKSFEQGKRAR